MLIEIIRQLLYTRDILYNRPQNLGKSVDSLEAAMKAQGIV